MSGKYLMFVIVLVVVLAALATSQLTGDRAAIDRAKAAQIKQQAEAQARAEAAAEARRQQDWESTRGARGLFFVVVAVTGAAVLVLGLVLLGYRGWQVSRTASEAWDTFANERARLAAGTIKVDRETRTFPALVVGDAVHQLEHGEVFRLGEPRPADPQQVTASAQVRALGVTAQAAERIGKRARGQQGHVAEALPGIAGATPLVLPPVAEGEEGRVDL